MNLGIKKGQRVGWIGKEMDLKTVEHRKSMLGLKDSGENVRGRHVCNMLL